jgi:hypothetical protein
VDHGGGPIGTHVTLEGSGFFANDLIRISLSGSGHLTTVLTKADGRFVATLTIPTVPTGTHNLLAAGETSRAFAVTEFAVTSTQW